MAMFSLLVCPVTIKQHVKYKIIVLHNINGLGIFRDPVAPL